MSCCIVAVHVSRGVEHDHELIETVEDSARKRFAVPAAGMIPTVHY